MSKLVGLLLRSAIQHILVLSWNVERQHESASIRSCWQSLRFALRQLLVREVVPLFCNQLKPVVAFTYRVLFVKANRNSKTGRLHQWLGPMSLMVNKVTGNCQFANMSKASDRLTATLELERYSGHRRKWSDNILSTSLRVFLKCNTAEFMWRFNKDSLVSLKQGYANRTLGSQSGPRRWFLWTSTALWISLCVWKISSLNFSGFQHMKDI